MSEEKQVITGDEQPQNEHLRLWEMVEKTDPTFTKKIEFGKRAFTSIAAMYQIKNMTAVSGVAGIGWGVKDEKYDWRILKPSDGFTAEMVKEASLLVYTATLYFNFEGTVGEFPIAADIPIWEAGKSGWRVNEDIVKKVRTDALTKGFSYLGFNADVFMGMFDDNKYVKQMEQEFGSSKPSGESRHTGAQAAGIPGQSANGAPPKREIIAFEFTDKNKQRVNEKFEAGKSVDDVLRALDSAGYSVSEAMKKVIEAEYKKFKEGKERSDSGEYDYIDEINPFASGGDIH